MPCISNYINRPIRSLLSFISILKDLQYCKKKRVLGCREEEEGGEGKEEGEGEEGGEEEEEGEGEDIVRIQQTNCKI